tara:strand:+ start:338 stop:547 length:210 start_codon:yes stop_codon:yes gene_type:complete
MDEILNAEELHEKCIEHVEEYFMATCMELVSSDRLDDADALHREFAVDEDDCPDNWLFMNDLTQEEDAE